MKSAKNNETHTAQAGFASRTHSYLVTGRTARGRIARGRLATAREHDRRSGRGDVEDRGGDRETAGAATLGDRIVRGVVLRDIRTP